MSTAAWGGRRVQRARAYVAKLMLPGPCGQGCGGEVAVEDEWVVGHIKSRVTHPELVWDPKNWRPEHAACSNRSAQSVVQEKAAADALRAHGIDPRSSPVFDAQEAPHLPFSLPGDQPRPRVTATTKATASMVRREPLEIRTELQWNPEELRQYPWLREFADVPADASPPLAMTPPHPDAICSYGWSGCTHLLVASDTIDPEPQVLGPKHTIVAWAEAEHHMTLRWWQRLAIVRQHEHRADGTLCWTEIVESASRRSGKSARIRAVATWRLAHAAVVGELQAIVHCGNDLPICRDVQKKAWRWAEKKWGREAVTKGNGKESIENPDDGSHWIVKAQDAAYGYDAGLAVVDEAWDVKPDTVTEGLEPMLLERLWPQLHITSTAHRRARSIMKSKISGPLAADDGRTLILLWGARPQDDPGDPETWRNASPHWTESRRALLADKYEKALAGEADPQADDPDPMAGFVAQYLNVWTLLEVRSERGKPIVDRAAWTELTVATTDAVPAAVAIESWFDTGVSVAFAWRLHDGAAAVQVVEVPDLAGAAAAATASGYTGPVVVGASLDDDPALRGIKTTPARGRGIATVLDLSRLLRDGQLAHAGSPSLTSQVLGVRLVDGSDGPRLASQGRTDALKAATWAANAARAKPARRRSARVLTSSVGRV